MTIRLCSRLTPPVDFVFAIDALPTSASENVKWTDEDDRAFSHGYVGERDVVGIVIDH